MIQGDPEIWLGRIQDVEKSIISRISAVWPKCLTTITPEYSEDNVTNTLVFHLRRDQIARECGAIHPQMTLPEDEIHAERVKGHIDIAVVLDSNPDVYVAFECKRLNVTEESSWKSLAGPYAEDGVIRYVFEQYAENLPVGAMLGYVYDGDINRANAKIHAAIAERSKMLNLVAKPATAPPPVNAVERFSTYHRRSRGGDIEVRHSLLSLVPTNQQ